jgi:RHS repeat-associated protein
MPWGVLSGVETGIGIPIDSNGNFTTDGTKTYEWDAENRLTRVTQGVTELARFTYDGWGRRAQKIVGAVTRSYVYDGPNIIEERLSSGQTYDYVHGPGIDRPLAMRDQASVVSYYLADHLGSIVQTTNAAAAVTLTREYDPWGNPIQGSAASGYAFTGREWDPETGLYYFRARYLDPKAGRFLNEDPIGLRGGLNLYRYVENNPVRYVDPSGLETGDINQGFGGPNPPMQWPRCQPKSCMAKCLSKIFGTLPSIYVTPNTSLIPDTAVSSPGGISLPGSCDEFYGSSWLTLHEHYHVIMQWGTGNLTYPGWVWQVVKTAPAGIAGLARTGSLEPWHDAMPAEQQASGFADLLTPVLVPCLKGCKQCGN